MRLGRGGQPIRRNWLKDDARQQRMLPPSLTCSLGVETDYEGLRPSRHLLVRYVGQVQQPRTSRLLKNSVELQTFES